MPKTLDWLYHRKNCEGCKKAHAHFDAAGHAVGEAVDATKVKYGRDAAVALARTAKTVVAGRGKTATATAVEDATDDDLAALLLGPTGNLKAPTVRVGNTLIVGFNAAAYAEHLP